jgi:hypothetical protein
LKENNVRKEKTGLATRRLEESTRLSTVMPWAIEPMWFLNMLSSGPLQYDTAIYHEEYEVGAPCLPFCLGEQEINEGVKNPEEIRWK